MSESAVRPPARGAEFRVLVVAIVGAGVVFLDTTAANIALPAVQRALDLTTAQVQWAASAYLLTLACLLLVGGRLADVFGRRRMLLLGLAGYLALGTVAGLAPNGAVLVGARGLQGIAGAMLVPTTLALINAAYPPQCRGAAIGVWAAWSGVPTIAGPLLAGLVVDRLSWRAAFLIPPVLAAAAILLALPITESRDEQADRRLDWLGIALCGLALAGPVFALIEGPVSGWSSPQVLAGAVAGLVLGPAFLAWEARARSPLLPFEMFRNRDLGVANVVTLFVYAGLYGTFLYVALYVQTALRQSATVAGLVFIPTPIALFLLSPVAGRLHDRFGPRWLLTFGPLVAAAGLAIVGLTGPGQLTTRLVPGILLLGVGLGFTVAPVTATAIGSAEERFSGVASGFNNAVSRIAGLFAIAMMGVVVIQLWQAGLAAAASGASPEVGRALESVRASAFVSPKTAGMAPALTGEVARVVVEASQRSFRDAMLLAASLVALGGLVSAVWMRGRGTTALADAAGAGTPEEPATQEGRG